jgi:hypothetical protein
MDAFAALMSEVMSPGGHFGHREHLHLAWLAVRRHGHVAAAEMIAGGIQQTARYAGAPQKYHATMTGAWVHLVAHHVPDGPDDFDGFLERFPRLLDKRLLAAHYSSAHLASAEARSAWTEPDLAPLPAVHPAQA